MAAPATAPPPIHVPQIHDTQARAAVCSAPIARCRQPCTSCNLPRARGQDRAQCVGPRWRDHTNNTSSR
eukprot:6912045-Pyramimonas_sp.AAC.1